jgi:4-amino-4-deoxy-L-arabinose transferase-like glycosyltransferase
MIGSVALTSRLLLLPWFLDLPLAGDEEYYWLTAREHVFFRLVRPPLWTWILMVPASLSADPWLGRLVSVVIGSVTAAVVFAIARRAFDRRVAWLAGLLFCFYPYHVAYSHYLWSEVLLELLCALATLHFLEFRRAGNRAHLHVSALVLGIGFLAKEFAIVLFAALLFSLFVEARERRVRVHLLACGLFALPFSLYFVGVATEFGQPVMPYRMAVSNVMLAFPEAETEPGMTSVAKVYAGSLRARPIGEAIAWFGRSLTQLWSPNSFVLTRIRVKDPPRWVEYDEWAYGIEHPDAWVRVLALVQGLIVVTGLAGLILSPASPLRTLTLAALLILSLTGLLAFLVSRFREPFMYLLIVYSAACLSNPKALLRNAADGRRLIALVACLGLFLTIWLADRHNLGAWG